MRNSRMTDDDISPATRSSSPAPEAQPGLNQASVMRAGDHGPTVPAASGPAVAIAGSSDPRAADQPAPEVGGEAMEPVDQRPGPGTMAAPTFDPLTNAPQPPQLAPRLAAVATIDDPHLRAQVGANVRLQTQRENAAFTDAQRQAKAQAKQMIDQGGDLSTIPAKLMLQIDTPGRQALHDYVMAHGNPTTDPVTYYGLKNQALDDPVGFQSIDLSNHMAQLKPSDYAELQQLQISLKNGQPPADLPLQQAYKANTDRLLQQLGLPTETTTSPDPAANDNIFGTQQAALLRQAIDQHVAATEIATGRKMPPDDHHALLQRVSVLRQPSPTSAASTAPVVAGTTAAAPVSAWGARGAAAAEAAGELATGGGALVGSSLMATLAPILGLSAGILVGTTTSTASPALDEAPPVYQTLKTPGVQQLQILHREGITDEEREEEDKFCAEQRAECTELCLEAEHDSRMGNIWAGSFERCFNGCLPTKCGGSFR